MSRIQALRPSSSMPCLSLRASCRPNSRTRSICFRGPSETGNRPIWLIGLLRNSNFQSLIAALHVRLAVPAEAGDALAGSDLADPAAAPGAGLSATAMHAEVVAPFGVVEGLRKLLRHDRDRPVEDGPNRGIEF